MQRGLRNAAGPKRLAGQLAKIDTRRLDDDGRRLQKNRWRWRRERHANPRSPANLALMIITTAVVPSLDPTPGVSVAASIAIAVVAMAMMMIAMVVSLMMITIGKRR
jgi:hypothetical protein